MALEVTMRSRLGIACKPYRIALVLVLPPLISAWTCSSIVNFKSCPGAVPQPQLTALSPETISPDADSVPLTVDGNGFVYQSQPCGTEIRFRRGSWIQTIFRPQLRSKPLNRTVAQLAVAR